MKKSIIPVLLFFTLACLSSCSAIGGIFKSGAYAGIIVVIIVVAIILWVISKLYKKN